MINDMKNENKSIVPFYVIHEYLPSLNVGYLDNIFK